MLAGFVSDVSGAEDSVVASVVAAVVSVGVSVAAVVSAGVLAVAVPLFTQPVAMSVRQRADVKIVFFICRCSLRFSFIVFGRIITFHAYQITIEN